MCYWVSTVCGDFGIGTRVPNVFQASFFGLMVLGWPRLRASSHRCDVLNSRAQNARAGKFTVGSLSWIGGTTTPPRACRAHRVEIRIGSQTFSYTTSHASLPPSASSFTEERSRQHARARAPRRVARHMVTKAKTAAENACRREGFEGGGDPQARGFRRAGDPQRTLESCVYLCWNPHMGRGGRFRIESEDATRMRDAKGPVCMMDEDTELKGTWAVRDLELADARSRSSRESAKEESRPDLYGAFPSPPRTPSFEAGHEDALRWRGGGAHEVLEFEAFDVELIARP
ncbi:hypothetical protein DFH07DRAFT_779904 [Mycena maculata]|uniref:Uncharacterized protein n=1 Tax=Mycena maculata TaxID=230809 RepID=A0AAD7I5K5_9AGAR|nr:hypothetical protein DFH07DRAFT_779904 [Mycena maculata]